MSSISNFKIWFLRNDNTNIEIDDWRFINVAWLVISAQLCGIHSFRLSTGKLVADLTRFFLHSLFCKKVIEILFWYVIYELTTWWDIKEVSTLTLLLICLKLIIYFCLIFSLLLEVLCPYLLKFSFMRYCIRIYDVNLATNFNVSILNRWIFLLHFSVSSSLHIYALGRDANLVLNHQNWHSNYFL